MIQSSNTVENFQQKSTAMSKYTSHSANQEPVGDTSINYNSGSYHEPSYMNWNNFGNSYGTI